MEAIEKAGVVALGIFVGILVSLGIANTKLTVRTILSVLGAALGGVPVAFLGTTGAKWMYPLGLLVGFFWARVIPIANAESDSHEKSHLVSGAVVLAVVVALAAVVSGARLTQSGYLQLHEGTGLRHNIYYPKPFAHTPHLQIEVPAHFQITEQRPDGFSITLPQGYTVGERLRWKATGERK